MSKLLQHTFRVLPSSLVVTVAITVSLLGCRGDSTATSPNSEPKQFSFPFSTGTRWLYSYYFDWLDPIYGSDKQYHGLQQWGVSSVSNYSDSTVVLVVVSRVDTVHTIRRYPWDGPGPYEINTDTTYVAQQTNSFTIKQLSDSTIVRWTSNTVLAGKDAQRLENLARRSNSDTLKYYAFDGNTSVSYVNGVGLLNYVGTFRSNSGKRNESLTLLEASVK